MTGVAFPALSRIQHDAKRLARSFLRGYSLLISSTIPITITCALFAEEIVRVVLGAKWMEAAPIFRLLAPVAVVFAVANPFSWLVMSTGRVGRALSISRGDNAAGNRGDRTWFELWTQRSRPGVLVGYDVAGDSDSGLVQTWHRNHLGGSLGSHQTTVSVRFARRCGGLAREAHARWRVATNALSNGGAWSCFRHLRLGSSDCHETETRVHGRAVPAIATAPAETGRNRGTGREVAVIVTKRKMERYREALDQECSAISRWQQTCSCRSAGLVVRDLLIAVHCDKQPSVSSNPGEGGTLAGLRKVSCRLLFAAE